MVDVTRDCLYCGAEFKTTLGEINSGGGKYCCKKHTTLSQRNGSEISCGVCHKVFYVSEYNRDVNKRKYCSKKCTNTAFRTGSEIECIVCHKKFYCNRWGIKNGVKHCSRECSKITFGKKMKGRPSPRKGAKMSDETRKKLAHTWFKKGQIPWIAGKKHSEASKKKMEQSWFKKGQSTWNKGRPWGPETKEKLRQIRMNQIFPTKDTLIERLIQNELNEMDIKYEKHFVVRENGYASQLDVAIPDIKFAIECDGDYWHSLPNKQAYDDRTNDYCERNGWTLIRFSENNIKRDLNGCVKTIKEVLKI